ncbi:MAG: sodium/solute symporter [Prevotella sp.]|nr:sodium/solute symporter [Prevotella sp.]
MKIWKSLLALALILTFATSCNNKNEDKQFNSFKVDSLAQLTVGDSLQGVAAPFAGQIGNKLIVAGGCNFPEVPAAKGGAKRFYSDVYTLDISQDKNQWEKIGDLPATLAYGASVQVPEGIVCIGGTADGKSSSSSVMLLNLSNGRAKVSELDSLPVGLDQHAAAYANGIIYVAGGQTNGKLNTTVYAYDMVKKQWSTFAELDDEHPWYSGLQPCMAVQNGSNGSELLVMGGFNAETKTCSNAGISWNLKTKATHAIELYKGFARNLSVSVGPDPIKMYDANQYFALVGASTLPCGANNILVFGGVNKKTFETALQNLDPDYLNHPAEWYNFNDSLLVYNTITGAWSTTFADHRLARAGAAIVKGNEANTYYIINGELKPGVRSADVSKLTIDYTAQFGWLNYTVLVIYLIAMLLLGYFFMKRESGSEDFFKGGNRIPWWAAGISIFATMLSAITYMSIPAKAYMTDWTYYPMQICILLVSFPVIIYFLPFFRRLNVTTAYEYLEHRFSYAIRLMASVLFIVFMVARMALVLFLPSLAMTAVTGIDIYVCIVVMAIVTIIYCTMGGVEAVVWGDVIQGIILVGGAFLAAGYLIYNTGNGMSDFLQIAVNNDKLRLFDWSFDYRTATFWVVILGGLANNLISYTSDQTVIQRYLTTKDERSAARSIITNGMMSVIVTIAFFTIGTGLYTFYQTHPTATDLTMQKTDAIFPFFMMSQLPAGIAGLLIAAVFAATMSTISSNINSISTAFTVDIWKKIYPNISDKATVRTARITGIISGIIGMAIAILMATMNIQSLLDYFNTILGLLSGAVGALFIMGIFFPRIGARAAFIGFLAGTATVFWMNFYTPVNFLLFGFTAIVVSTLVALLLSFVWPERRPLTGFTWKTLEKKH